MKGFIIQVKNNLLEPKHVKKMGAAVWEYLWCLDKMTSINDTGVGKVLGGKPIKWKEVKVDIGKREATISENMTKLVLCGYITLKRTPYGNVIEVLKAKKSFRETSENRKSDFGKPQFSLRKTVNLTSENRKSNKTVQYDVSVDYTKDPTRLASKEAVDNSILVHTQGLTSIGDLINKKQK